MPDQPTELSLPDAIRYALELHRSGRLDGADTLYRRILAVAPDYADAVHFHGLLLHQRHRSDEGLALIERSLALEATAGRYNNLACALVERDRLEDAIAAFERSLALEPRNVDALNNLGSVQLALGRIADAERAYLAALAADPRNASALANLGNVRSRQRRDREAVDLFWQALSIHPSQRETRERLGFTYYALKEYDAAANVFRKWLESEPASPIAQHMLAACSGVDVPARASDRYVERTFDDFAESFDVNLARLEYRAPQLVCDALAKLVGAPARDRVILDAGCGTGLCGPLLAPYASRLVGVDLSARMLDGARRRGVYDELVKAELTELIAGRPRSADVIVSADTLCYFGALDAVLGAAARALRDGGWLIFTAEVATPEQAPHGHRINPHGRYSHTRAYLERALADAGLRPGDCEPQVLRTENNEPVHGFVVAARRLA